MSPFYLHTDQMLLDCIRNSEEAAFTELFARYNKLLYSHVFNKIRDEEAAKDIVQDIFVKVWEKRRELSEKNISAYLFVMARNKVLNSISHEKIVNEYKTFVTHASVGKNDHATADIIVREKQLAEMIEAEIAALPPRMREVFELRRQEGFSNKEIALTLNLSEHTVADQIKKSLRILRTRLGVFITLYFLIKYFF